MPGGQKKARGNMESANQISARQDGRHNTPPAGEKAEQEIKPGEWPFLIFLAFMTIVLLNDSFKLIGIVNGKLSSPSSIPQIILFTMLVLIAIIAATLLRTALQSRKAGALVERRAFLPMLGDQAKLIGNYLICKEVIILLAVVFAYAIVLPFLHFEISSLLFLFATMYLLDRKQPVKKLLISAGTLVMILIIFKFFMRVVLP